MKFDDFIIDCSTMLAYNQGMEYEINSPKHGKLKVLLDDEDKEFAKNSLYVTKNGQFLYVRMGPSKKYLHRAIMGFPKGKVVHHKNRDPLDNRRKNLQVATIQENLRDQKRPNNKTGYTGVAIAYDGKYSAQIKHNYKKIHLGVFTTIQEAYKARRKAEIKYWKI